MHRHGVVQFTRPPVDQPPSSLLSANTPFLILVDANTCFCLCVNTPPCQHSVMSTLLLTNTSGCQHVLMPTAHAHCTCPLHTVLSRSGEGGSKARLEARAGPRPALSTVLCLFTVKCTATTRLLQQYYNAAKITLISSIGLKQFREYYNIDGYSIDTLCNLAGAHPRPRSSIMTPS